MQTVVTARRSRALARVLINIALGPFYIFESH